jgi:hypothetical protein
MSEYILDNLMPYYSHELKLRLVAQALQEEGLISTDQFNDICKRIPLPVRNSE